MASVVYNVGGRNGVVQGVRTLMMAGVLLLATTACGGDDGPGGDVDGALRGRTFLSTGVTEDGNPRQLAKQTRIELQFTDDGRLIANAGCNSMQSPVGTDDKKIAAADLAITDMGCDPPRHAQDDWLAKVLGAKPSWKLEGQILTLTSGGTVITLEDKQAAQPNLPLLGTRWTLTTLIDGETASSSPAASKAYLTFEGGKVTGSTGCNDLSGTAVVEGKYLAFGPLGTTRKACAGTLATVEKAMLAVLKGTVRFEVTSSGLTLKGQNSKALGFTGS